MKAEREETSFMEKARHTQADRMTEQTDTRTQRDIQLRGMPYTGSQVPIAFE